LPDERLVEELPGPVFVRGRPRLRETGQHGTFCQLPQPLSYPAILLRVLAVAGRMFEVSVVAFAVFG
jgi:hypothetical protein